MTASIRNLNSAFRNWQGCWFLVQIKEIVNFEEELAETKNQIGARLCAKRQPQHVRTGNTRGFFRPLPTFHPLRPVFQTQSRSV